MKFNSTTGIFNTVFTVNTDIEAPTVVYRSDEYYYPHGYTWTLSDKMGNVLVEKTDFMTKELKKNYLAIQVVNEKFNG